jgi:hypothetical protein
MFIIGENDSDVLLGKQPHHARGHAKLVTVEDQNAEVLDRHTADLCAVLLNYKLTIARMYKTTRGRYLNGSLYHVSSSRQANR